MYVVTRKSIDEKTFWSLFFQNDNNIITEAFNRSIGDELHDININPDVQSLKEAALDFSMESLDLQELSAQPLISAVNRWSSVLLPLPSTVHSYKEDSVNFTDGVLFASLDFKSPTDYVSKASKQMFRDSISKAQEMEWNSDINFTASTSLPISKGFKSLEEITNIVSNSDQLVSFLSTREDIKLFHDKVIQVLRIFWSTASPSEGLFKAIERLLGLFRIMRSSFPSKVSTLGISLEESLTYALNQNVPPQKKLKPGAPM